MRLLKRVFLSILVLLAALIVLLAGSIFVDSVLGAHRLDNIANITIPGANGGPDVQAYMAKPQEEGPFPTVIVIHEFWGLNESIVGKADLLAQEG
jgi:carboxymethylenebutenolidase